MERNKCQPRLTKGQMHNNYVHTKQNLKTEKEKNKQKKQSHRKPMFSKQFSFAFTAAGVVPCGTTPAAVKANETSPRTSTIVQFIFYFWSFEISMNILRNQK